MGSRSESLSNCSIGKKRLEKSPSFASEWDEVRLCDVTEHELAAAHHSSPVWGSQEQAVGQGCPGSFAL